MKRFFDFAFALFLSLILIIPAILIFIAVKLSSRGQALYYSKRVGKNNIIFAMPKFRTMKINTPAVATHLLNNPDQFLTPIGKFLRQTSLDELPQLLSILRGQMSFVGPRPALFNQDDLIKQRKELGVDELTPGLTGWAQINGRDEISIFDKVKLDKYYLDHKSFFFDLKIIYSTFFNVFSAKDISH